MQISLRKYIATVVLVLALGALAGLLYTDYSKSVPNDRGLTGPDFPRFTVEEDGSVSKDIPPLSVASLARVPSRQLKLLIFGINPVVVEPTTTIPTNTERVLFRVENKPSDIFKEYKEYITAIGWTYYASESSLSLVVRTATAQTTIDIAPQSPDGSLVVISRKQLP